MRQITYIFLGGLISFFVGCSSSMDSADHPVRFSGVLPIALDATWSSGDNIGVFMYETGTQTELAGNVLYTTTASDGNFISNNPILIPESGVNVDFIAYYPYKSTLSSPWIYPVDVSDQSSLPAIDLIYSNTTVNMALSPTPIGMVFEHKLSKITINVVPGTGFVTADLTDMEVLISGMPTTVGFDPVYDSFDTPGNINDITTSIAEAGLSYEAIVIPQTSGTARHIIFNVAGEHYTHSIPNIMYFRGGHNHIYTIIIHKTGIAVSGVEINTWTNGSSSSPIDIEKSILIPETVRIPSGTFQMGSLPVLQEPNREADESQHWVQISKDFYMGKYEITFDQYDAFCDATGRVKPSDQGYGRGKHPVIWVSWQDAVDYCAWLSTITGKQWRLPTESEWEYACCAGTISPFNFVIPSGIFATNSGWEILENLANFNTQWPYYFGTGEATSESGNEGIGQTVPVGGYYSNTWGLYNMHDNVTEWVSDWYASYPDAVELNPLVDPQGAEEGIAIPPLTEPHRVLRGGGWSERGKNCRSAYRYHDNMNENYTGGSQSRGFRVVMEK